MAADLAQLDPLLQKAIAGVYRGCLAFPGHFEFRPNFTGRTPWQQARLWRQSRALEEVADAVQTLKTKGADYLAQVLEEVGPQHGPWATNALPGQSWHNWKPARAVDSFLVRAAAAVWDGGDPGYLALRTVGERLGLTSLARIHDYGHLQLDADELPQRYSLAVLSETMRSLWGEKEITSSVGPAVRA